MRALTFAAFGTPPVVAELPDPVPPAGGVVVRVAATGLCRSDWHAWAGHDAGVGLPHVPGHELTGTVAAVGGGVTRWRVGDRVTTPFVLACGACPTCAAGDQQVCPDQQQPGFDLPGSFAELVALPRADVNLVAVPDALDAGVAALLGCRVATAYRAVVDVGRVAAGEAVAVHGCGGLGLAAVAVAAAAGARVVAVDPSAEARGLAVELGADEAVEPGADLRAAAHLSLDAAGTPASAAASVLSLRRRGRHVQAGLLPGGAHLPMDVVVAGELEVLGSHGMPAHAYPRLLALLPRLGLERVVTRTVGLADAGRLLADGSAWGAGVTVVDPHA